MVTASSDKSVPMAVTCSLSGAATTFAASTGTTSVLLVLSCCGAGGKADQRRQDPTTAHPLPKPICLMRRVPLSCGRHSSSNRASMRWGSRSQQLNVSPCLPRAIGFPSALSGGSRAGGGLVACSAPKDLLRRRLVGWRLFCFGLCRHLGRAVSGGGADGVSAVTGVSAGRRRGRRFGRRGGAAGVSVTGVSTFTPESPLCPYIKKAAMTRASTMPPNTIARNVLLPWLSSAMGQSPPRRGALESRL